MFPREYNTNVFLAMTKTHNFQGASYNPLFVQTFPVFLPDVARRAVLSSVHPEVQAAEDTSVGMSLEGRMHLAAAGGHLGPQARTEVHRNLEEAVMKRMKIRTIVKRELLSTKKYMTDMHSQRCFALIV